MIKCKHCILLKKEGTCRKCRNAIGKMYLDFLTEVREIVQGFGDPVQKLDRINKSIYLEGQMISSITPHNLKEMFEL